jgi:tRNA-splicing ligase RtcB
MKWLDYGKGIKSWCNYPEDGAIEQAKNVAGLPFLFKYVALMPDTHEGYGVPIGGVIALKNAIIPNAVGVDIGCGMLACQLDVEGITIENLKLIMGDIRDGVPVGFDHKKEKTDISLMPAFNHELEIVCQQFEPAMYQLGTLGGGNHFIEIQNGDDGHIWFMVHSGSRNVGLQVAKHYNKLAQSLNARWFSEVTKDVDLAFLPIGTSEFRNYLDEMNWCLAFAQANRDLMANVISHSFYSRIGATVLQQINIHHNYAVFENHFGENVIVHRKGATSAKLGQLGIIPGSQGTASYIVVGKGNPDSFMSSSHGAGRKMGRKAAINNLDLKEEQRMLDEQGILHSIRGKQDLDEAAGAYKNIDTVMEEQTDLVEIKTKLLPLAVVKG